MFGHAVVQTEVRAMFCFPLRLGAATVGVVDLYRLSPGGLSDLDLTRAAAIAEAVAGKAAAYAAAEAERDERPDSTGPSRQNQTAMLRATKTCLTEWLYARRRACE